MKVFFSPQCLVYKQEGHPESPERIERTVDFLKKQGYLLEETTPVKEKALLLCHSREMVEMIKREAFSDLDTPAYPGIFEIARLSAGGAIAGMHSALKGESTFSLMRPPGHHASSRVEGFCLFNNIAIATKRALEQVKRVAILDIDVHHGNGTQDIFLGSEKVLYVSVHQQDIYPGTGLKSEKNCLNYPLLAGAGEKEWLNVFEKGIEEVKRFSPEIIAVSAGFDAHREDPIAGLSLESETYRKVGETITRMNVPAFAVMEGGYSNKVPESVWQFLKGLEGGKD